MLLFSVSATAVEIDFGRDIQPLLSENCYHCHGPDANERKADLRLDEAKPAQKAAPDIVERLFSSDPDEVMPPPKSNRSLTAAQKALIKQWIDEGAKWGVHWAFQRIEKPRARGIDELVEVKLKEKGWKMAPEADAVTLLRRVSLDLTGLPPATEEVAAFLKAIKQGDNQTRRQGEAANPPVSLSSPQTDEAYERAVDKLLASPRFGERWCWDWLDAARYADTNGYQGDPERTMWPWRDWVVRAINANMPYDQFTVWQLAGDLLPDATPEQKLATGFNRNHMINGEGGRIAEETRVENVFDRVETTGTVWLGLTMACTKCHDHKFDPLTMRDYYGLYDVFNQTSEDGIGRSGQAAPAMDMSTPAELQRVKKAQTKVDEIAAEVEAFELKKFPRAAGKPLTESAAADLPGNLPAYIAKTAPSKRGVDPLLEAVSYFKGRDAEYARLLQKLLAAVRERVSAANSITKVMIMDTLAKPRTTYVLDKGAYDKPTTTKVSFNTPAVLPPLAADAPRNRLGLAQWIVSRDNPLTARVTVNRFWQALFGVGLVKTAEDFGVQGEKPVHRELLDFLAADFMEHGWDVKRLLKQIVMSRTYRQSSRFSDPGSQLDPENRYLARGPRHRLPSWMMRDQALFVSGLLKEQAGGPPVKPYQPEGIWEEATFGKKSYKPDTGDSLYRRTLYTFWRRIVGPTMLFDNAARQTCVVKTSITNTPLHALVTLNDVTYVEAARALAQRVLLQQADREEQALTAAFRLVTCRAPSAKEAQVLKDRLHALRARHAADPAAAAKLLAVGGSKRDEKLDAVEHAAWTGLCLMLLNLDEVLSKG
jgi:hypothetical protein